MKKELSKISKGFFEIIKKTSLVMSYHLRKFWRYLTEEDYKLVTIIVFVTAFFIFWLGLDLMKRYFVDVDARRLFLATVAQTLATVAGIFFSIMLIATQLASRYSHRLFKMVFTKWTFVYMALFIINVLLSLLGIVLKSDLLLKVTVGLTPLCLLLLIPCFLWLTKKLTPESLITSLKEKAEKTIRKGSCVISDFMILIENISFSAIGVKDYHTFSVGISALCRIATMGPLPFVGWRILAQIEKIAYALIDDPIVIQIITYNLHEAASIAVTNREKIADVEGVISAICLRLRQISIMLVKKRLTEQAIETSQHLKLAAESSVFMPNPSTISISKALSYLNEIAGELIRVGCNEEAKSVVSMFINLATVYKIHISNKTDTSWVIDTLYDIESKTSEQFINDAFDSSHSSIPNKTDAFNKIRNEFLSRKKISKK